MTFLDLPEGLPERIIQCNSNHKVRFGSVARLHVQLHRLAIGAKFLPEEDSVPIPRAQIKSLKGHQLRTGSILGFDGSKSFAGDMAGIEQPSDVLIPAAMESTIHEENAERIKAHIVVEAAYSPVAIDQA
ncbi:hypothetical protein [Rhizobium mongolense]|uniref:Glutamate dehydrogenase/leucine dehydrogenase n=1 Tax=Rhizobium mongolense TaxID=57676 RepID=A0A7W6RS86_9HYPH|nr:hypothetical protein [Rhizobium mongolense]MBB4277663.1 glutamate dehydrogenase/leucine dehydrogenase [Rhizobium mongolense]